MAVTTVRMPLVGGPGAPIGVPSNRVMRADPFRRNLKPTTPNQGRHTWSDSWTAAADSRNFHCVGPPPANVPPRS